MKILRARVGQETPSYFEIEGDKLWPLTGDFHDMRRTSGEAPLSLKEAQMCAPVTPSKIIAVGPNYVAHLAGNPPPPRPYFWIKPPSVVNDPEGVIYLGDHIVQANHEPEVAIIIGRKARNVSPEKALDYVLGYSCINDVTAGHMQDPQVFMASMDFVDGKIDDGFGPMGPWIETSLDTSNLRVQCRVNGETRQDHRTSGWIFRPEQLISMISARMTLFPGDVIATGSPPGVGPLEDGDTVEVDVEGIGVLKNYVKRAVC